MSRRTLLAAPFAVTFALAASLAVAAPRHASYTADQAARGRLEYIQNCGECHGGDLAGQFGPALAGPNGRAQYESGASVYAYTIAHMPNGNAGALPQNEYLDIMAYIYERNGVPAGARELTAQTVARDDVALGK
jgi:mono/diheme cytochrome c family protein